MEGPVICLALCWTVATMLTGTWAQLEPNCPVYVSEGQKLSCTCMYKSPTPPVGTPQFSWPNHSTTATLEKDSVQRTDNGTTFTCEMSLGGQTNTTVYTLQVAYGPSDADLSISGPQPILANGTNPVTLTCLAVNVNPAPSYTWSGVACSNGNQSNVCTFTPQLPGDEGREVTCTAFNKYVLPGGQTAKKNFTLTVNYPPSDPPEITGYTEGQPLSTGDNLKCTVKGGNPLVAIVIFHCLDPKLPDEDDVRDTSSVSSPLTINTTTATSSLMTCVCLTSWSPDPGLYASMNHAVINVTIDYTPPTTTPPKPTTTLPLPTTTTTTPTTTPPSPAPTTVITDVTTSSTTKPTAEKTTQATATGSATPSPPTPTTKPPSEATTSSAVTSDRPSPKTTTSSAVTSDSPSSEATTSSAVTSGRPSPGGGTTAGGSPSATPTQPHASTSGPVRETTADVRPGASVHKDEFPVAIFAGVLAGAVFLIIIIVVIVVLCRKKKERDVRLVSTAEYADGSYKPTASKDFFVFENNGYDQSGMSEIETTKPTNGALTSSLSGQNSSQYPQNPSQYAAMDFYAPVPEVRNSTQEVSVSFEDDTDNDKKDEVANEREADAGTSPSALEASPTSGTGSSSHGPGNPSESHNLTSFGIGGDDEDDTAVAVGGDVYAAVNKANEPSDDAGDAEWFPAEQHDTTGPLGDTYAQVNRPTTTGDDDDNNADPTTESISGTMNFEDAPESSGDLAASPSNRGSFAAVQPMNDVTAEQTASVTFESDEDHR